MTGAGVLLCSGGTDLRQPGAAYKAVMRYNQSDAYVRTVLSIADAYRRGVTVVPMSALPAARPAAGTGSATPDGSGFAYAGSPAPRPAASSSARPTPELLGEAVTRTVQPEALACLAEAVRRSPSRRRPRRRASPSPGLPVPLPSVPGVPLPPVPLPPVPPLPVPTLTAEIVRLLALPHLPLLPGDPKDLVRVLDPLKAKVVCVLVDKVVTCPTSGLLG